MTKRHAPFLWLGALAAGVWLFARPKQLTADQIVANARAELDPLRAPIKV